MKEVIVLGLELYELLSLVIQSFGLILLVLAIMSFRRNNALQKTILRYDYASHEQIVIDKLVFDAYGLNADDIQEVENWYARCYSKLSIAQKANLMALGRSDDYSELYGVKKTSNYE